MAYVPSSVIEGVQSQLVYLDGSALREATDMVEIFEKRLADARRHLVEVRNRRAKLARFLRENDASD